MLALRKAEGLPPHSAIARCFEWKILLQVKPGELLSLPWQVKAQGLLPPPDPFKLNQLEGHGRALKGMSQAPL